MEEQTTPRTWRLKPLQTGIGVALLVLVIATGLYVNSDAFRERVRARIVATLEEMTGGRVELQQFAWNLSRLEFEVKGLTIHGLEGPEEVPYAHIDRLFVRLKIISLFSREIGLRELTAERPVIHIIVYPDGSTNQPTPKVVTEKKTDPVTQLFKLAIEKVELREGEFLFNQRRMPLDFVARNLSAEMTYGITEQVYRGVIHVGDMETVYQNFRPLKSNAELRFAFREKQAEISAFNLSTAKSRFQASGSIEDYLDPKVRLQYNASLDMAELAAAARMPEVRSGRLDLKGAGTYAGVTEFASSGQMTIAGLSYLSPGLRVQNAGAHSHYSLDEKRLSLSQLNGVALGGRFTGEAQIYNFLNVAAEGSKKQPAGPPQRGTADLRLAGFSVRTLAEAISSRTLPLDRLNLAGTAGGTIKAEWTGSPANAEAVITLAIVPPQPAPGQLPVESQINAVYSTRRQVLHVREMTLAVPNTSLRASGTLGTENAELRVSVTSRSLREFQPMLAVLRPGIQMPVQLEGPATFHGVVSGRLASPVVSGRLEMGPFWTQVTLPAQAHAGGTVPAAGPSEGRGRQTRVRWNSLVADLNYSMSGLVVRNAALRRGKMFATANASIGLRNGALTPASVFDVRAQLRNANVAELQSLAGFNYPVGGTLNANFHAAGTQSDMRGSGSFALTDGTAYGETFRSLTADLRLAGKEAQLQNIVMAKNGGQVRGSAAYNTATERFGFDLRGQNLSLDSVAMLRRGSSRVSGVIEFTAQGGGTLAAPVINADLRGTGLSLNGEAIGDLTAHAVTRGESLELQARSSFQQAQVAVDGNIRLRGDFPGRATLRFTDLNAAPYLRGFMQGSSMAVETVLAGTIEASGPFKRPAELNVEGNLEKVWATLEGVSIRNDGPVLFSVRDGVATIQQFHLTGDGTDLRASGSAQLAGAQALNLRANGTVNLKLAQTFNRDLVSSGMTELAVEVAGTMKQPDVRGQVRIADGMFALTDMPNALSEVNGTLVFAKDRLQVQSLRARTGGGELQMGGFLALRRGELFFDLTAQGDEIRVRYPPGVSATADADLRLNGTVRGAQLSGDVVINRFSLNPRFDFALYLARSNQPVTTPRPDSILASIRLDVRVTSTPELRVETSLAKLSGDVDLRVRGTAFQPAVLGRVNIAEGNVFFNGTEYHLERGDVLFTNPVRIEPIVNIEASARVREYDITLSFHGTTDKLNTTYRSDPPLPSQDIIALLALGRTREEGLSSPTNTSFTETASNAILGQALNAAVSSQVQRLFGVSRIKIDPQVGGPEGATAKLTIEQQVSNKVTLTYITNLSSAQQQVIQVEYNLNRNVSIVAVRDQNGVVGLDVRVRHRKR